MLWQQCGCRCYGVIRPFVLWGRRGAMFSLLISWGNRHRCCCSQHLLVTVSVLYTSMEASSGFRCALASSQRGWQPHSNNDFPLIVLYSLDLLTAFAAVSCPAQEPSSSTSTVQIQMGIHTTDADHLQMQLGPPNLHSVSVKYHSLQSVWRSLLTDASRACTLSSLVQP